MSTVLFLLLAGVVMLTNAQQDTCPSNGCTSGDVAVEAAADNSPNDHFYIGGMFGVHSMGTDPYTCGNWRLRGMVNMEAFFWAINRYASIVGNNPNGVYVGGFAMDTCARSSKAIESVYSFETCRTQYSNIEPRNVIAYVGPDTSDQGVATGQLLGEMNRTQVAHSATTPVLSDSDRFPFFLRTALSADTEMKVLAEFLAARNISHVQVMYNDNEFGMGLRQAFDKYAMGEGSGMRTCVVKYMPITDDTLLTMATSLMENTVSKYILLLTDNVGARRVLARSDELGLQGQFIYVGINSWSNDPSVIAGLSSADKAITLSVDSDSYYNKNDVDAFWIDFFNMKPSTPSNTGESNVNTHNPWFSEWWQAAFNCRFDLGTCDVNNQNLRTIMDDSEVYVPFTLMAVEAIIRGTGDAANTYCGGLQVCSRLLNREDDIVYQAIRDAQNSMGTRFFENNGDVSSSFFRYNLNQVRNGVSEPLLKASFNNDGSINLVRNTGNQFLLDLIPTGCKDSPCTQCGEVAPTTQSTVVVTTQAQVATTTQDPEEALALLIARYFEEDQEFTGIWRDQERDSEDNKTRFENGHDWIIAIGVCAGLGIVCVLIFEVYILYKLMGTNIGKQWRTMWLGQLLLFGIFLCYLTVIAYIWTPTKATCGITRFGVGVSYSICFAILLVKLMVLLTSKTSADTLIPSDVDSPNYLRGIYQFLMFIFVVGVQVVIAVMWLIMVPPDAVQVYGNNAEKVWICNHYTWSIAPGSGWNNMTSFVRTEFENHVISLTYIMFLIVLTTIIAMKAHGIITNHRESVFIGIAAGFSIPVWVAWGLIGGLNKDHAYAQEFGDGCIAFGLVITATVLLFSMFLPKVRQLVNMGVEGIYLEDDRDTYYAGSVIMAPPSYKSRPGSSVVYVNNNGFDNPVMLGDPNAVHLKHPGSTSTYSAPVYVKRPESTTGGSGKILRMTGDLTGKPQRERKSTSEAGYAFTGSQYGTYRKTRSEVGTLRKSTADLGAL